MEASSVLIYTPLRKDLDICTSILNPERIIKIDGLLYFFRKGFASKGSCSFFLVLLLIELQNGSFMCSGIIGHCMCLYSYSEISTIRSLLSLYVDLILLGIL